MTSLAQSDSAGVCSSPNGPAPLSAAADLVVVGMCPPFSGPSFSRQNTLCRGRPAPAVGGFAAYGGGVPLAGARRPVPPRPVLLPAGHPMGPPPEPSEAVPVGRGRRNGAERSPRRQAGTEWAEFLLTMWGLTPWSGRSSRDCPSINRTPCRGRRPRWPVPPESPCYPWPVFRAYSSLNRIPAMAGTPLPELPRPPWNLLPRG